MLYIFLTFLLSPYYLTSDFRRMFIYEQELVRGVIDVFYTRQFLHTLPVVFQFQSIFPYSLGYTLTVLFPIIFFVFWYFVFRYLIFQKTLRTHDFILGVFFLIFF